MTIKPRYRIVKEIGDERFVSGLIITEDEIPEAIDWEAQLHEATGWTVNRYGPTLRAVKDGNPRWIWVRSKPPLEDTV
jgi:hypothetical protein